MVTSSKREQNFAPVRIPLYKGILGYRVFLTHKDNLSRFENIDESALKQLVACQGESWPDSSTLEHNGYTVATASRFIQLIKLTHKKRCDYFPRAIYEGLNTAIKDGSFQHLFDQHSALKYLHPLEQWRHKSVFKLNNPTLP